MAFTPQEQARLKHFGSYPDWSSLAASIQLGFPSGAQPLFLIEDAFKRLTPGGEASVRIDLCECESIERQMSQARARFAATQIGNLKTNPKEMAMLRHEMTYWVLRMMSDLGVTMNPYAVFEYYGGGGGGRNATVV